MPIPEAELTIDFGPIAPDAPEDAPVSFSVRNEQTGESWPGGEFRSPLDEAARNDVRWYLEEYGLWPFGPFRDRDLLAEAEAHARRAWEIDKHLDASVEPWKDCAILAQIAERRGSPEEPRRWRRREQESFAAFAGSSLEVQKWAEEMAVVAAACKGDEEARRTALQIIGHYRDSKDWGKLVAAFARMLDGERGRDVLLEGLDRIDAAIIIHTMAALAGEAQPPPRPAATPPPTLGEGAGQAITLEQVFDLVEAGCRGDTQAGQLAYGLVTQVLQASSNPPQIRALGKTLQRILEGLRGEEALAGLPAELRPPVEALLRRLTHSSP
jgi:hypothetical protein